MNGMNDKPGMGMNATMPMMKMYFHFAIEETVLFESWRFTDSTGLAIACASVVVFCILYEFLRFSRQILYGRHFGQRNKPCPEKSREYLVLHHIVQSVLYTWQNVMGLIIMLIFMTFNIYLCIAVTVGSGLGFLMFGWKKRSVEDGHCDSS